MQCHTVSSEHESSIKSRYLSSSLSRPSYTSEKAEEEEFKLASSDLNGEDFFNDTDDDDDDDEDSMCQGNTQLESVAVAQQETYPLLDGSTSAQNQSLGGPSDSSISDIDQHHRARRRSVPPPNAQLPNSRNGIPLDAPVSI